MLAAARHQMPMCVHNALMGAATRASGLRTASIAGRGELAKSNADQVRKIRRLLSELSFEIATPAETRERLALKGGDNVNF